MGKRFVFGVHPEGIAYGSGKRYVSSEIGGAGAMSLEEVECEARKFAMAHRKCVNPVAYEQMYSGRYMVRVEFPCEVCRERRAKEDAAWKKGYPLYSPEKAAKLARKCEGCGGNGVLSFVSLVVSV